MNGFKSKLQRITSKLPGYRFLVLCNSVIFHFGERKRKIFFYGKRRKNKLAYVTTPVLGKGGSILGEYLAANRQYEYAAKRGYIPILRLEQKNPSWEACFNTEPIQNLGDIDGMVFAGWTIASCLDIKPKPKPNDCKSESLVKPLLQFRESHPYIKVTERVINTAEELERKYIDSQTLGVYIRGTDYIKMKPAFHPRQPDIQQVLKKTKEYIETYNINNIFLVSEDNEMLHEFSDGINCIDSSIVVNFEENHVMKDYDGKSYIVDYYVDEEDVIINNNVMYIAKMLTLSKCKYFIGGITGGTRFMELYSEYSGQKRYYFDLGVYGRD